LGWGGDSIKGAYSSIKKGTPLKKGEPSFATIVSRDWRGLQEKELEKKRKKMRGTAAIHMEGGKDQRKKWGSDGGCLPSGETYMTEKEGSKRGCQN